MAVSHHPLRKEIFFVFWDVLRATGLVVEDFEGGFKAALLRKKLSFVTHIGVVILIGVLFGVRMNHFAKRAPMEERFTYNWCVSFVLMNESAFHLLMFALALYWVRGGVFREFFHNLATIHPDKFLDERTLKNLRKSFYLMLLMCAMLLTSTALSSVHSLFAVFDSLPLMEGNNETAIAAIPDFGKSMFQHPHLYPIDVIVDMFAVMVSSTVLALFYLMHSAIHLEYSQFNEELEVALEGSRLTGKPDLVRTFSSRQLVLMRVMRAMNSRSEVITSVCFLTGIAVNTIAFFVFTSYSKQMTWFKAVTWSAWALTSMVLMVVPFKKIGDIYNEIEKTKHLLLFDKVLWNSGDEKLINDVSVFVDRVNNCRIPIYVFDAFEIKMTLLGKALLLPPLVSEVLIYLQNINN